MFVVSAVCAALVCLCAGLAAAAVWLWACRQRTSIPGPPTLPLLGNALTFYKLPVLWDRLAELHRRYGDIFRLYVGPKLVIVLTQPEDVQRVLVGSKPRDRDPYLTYILRTFLGDGLLTVNGDTWKRRRRFLEPAFHKEELHKFMDKFNDAGRFLCGLLKEREGAEVDLYHPLTHTALRAALATIFDVELERIIPERHRQNEAVDKLNDFGKAMSVVLYRPWTIISLIRWMTAEGRALTRFNTVLQYLFDCGFVLASQKLSGLKASERTILTFLLKDNNGTPLVTDKEIHDEAATLGAAGVETLSSTMGYIFTLLGLYPEWQDLAHRELDDYFGTGGDYLRAVTTADLAQLKVIDAIIKECGRLFGAVAGMPYVVAEDTPLAGGRHTAPRGSTVLVAYCLMHRHPGLFPQPDKFDPGRFLEGGSAVSRKAYSYLPFGFGARKCIGDRYAVLEMKVILATVLRHYRILRGTSREQLEESVFSITAHPVTGFRATFIPRHNMPSQSV